MSAYFDTGFCVRQPSWHKQETLLADYPDNWDDARRAAGLMWEPTYLDLYVPRVIQPGEPVPAHAVTVDEALDEVGAPRRYHVPVEGHRAIARDDTMQVLATPTDSFELIYHHQMGELLDAYTQAWRKAGATVKFETAGSVDEGRRVYALVYLDEPFRIVGDDSPSYPFAALLNAHDGTAACKLLPTTVRVVCWNTWKMAEAEGDRTGNQIVLRHSGNVAQRVEDAKVALGSMRDEAKEWEVLANDLAGINVSDTMFRDFLDAFIPVPEGATDRTRNDRAARRDLFTRLYHGDLAGGITMDGITGNGYGLVQAAGEYLDHLRPFRSADTYLARTMFTPEPVKRGAIKLVRELAAAGV